MLKIFKSFTFIVACIAQPSLSFASSGDGASSEGEAVPSGMPLSVENIVTAKGAMALELSLTYSNVETDGVSVGQPLSFQISQTSAVLLPPQLVRQKSNQDTMIATATLRNGFTSGAEVYLRASAVHATSRFDTEGVAKSISSSRFADIWTGVSYQFSSDARGVAVVGLAEIALLERGAVQNSSLKSYLVGLLMYKAYDPVVVAGSITVRSSAFRRDGTVRFKLGDTYSIRPTIGFAANERINLTTGLQWRLQKTSRFDGRQLGISRTSIDIVLGAGFGLSGRDSLNVYVEANASGRNGADLRLSWLKAF